MNLSNIYDQVKDWGRRHQFGKKLLILIVLGSTLSVIATFSALFSNNRRVLITFLSLDFVFLMILGSVVAKYLVSLWAERKSDQAGSKLHTRMVTIFSLLAIVPTILIAGFASIFLNIVIQSWFNERVETAIGESIAIAGAYLGEHQKVISANAQAIAAELSPMMPYLSFEPERLEQKLTQQTELRGLDEAIIFDHKMQVLGRSRFSFSLNFEKIPAEDLEQAKTTPVIYTTDQHNSVRALVAINPLEDTYLLVGRRLSPTVLSRIENAEMAAQEYARLEAEGSGIALKFAAMFVGIAILLLLAAVLGGLMFANKLAKPIGLLIHASEEVCRGNLAVRITDEEETEELSSLTSAFNRMTEQLESQRDELLIANEQIDERRRFIETVLAGVSAGVIGLDAKGKIHLANGSASELLALDMNKNVGKKLTVCIPEMASLFEEIQERKAEFIEKQISLNRDGHAHTLLVRLSLNRAGNKIVGYVMTFDDITQLQAAQRKAAWADVARRIAHEIKNPLTPIQLSAERLKRRYSQQISQDPETFQNCVDTIIRQVDHIGKMVSEFSSFARMPAPNVNLENLSQICKEEIFLQQNGNPKLKFQFSSSPENIFFLCDRGQIGQVLTNLLQNAVEAIHAKALEQGQINMTLKEEKKNILLKISDNGVGLPPEGRERLTEPYVTFREKGTGLGLAIVKKIVEDHGGILSFQDNPSGGTIVQVSFKREYV